MEIVMLRLMLVSKNADSFSNFIAVLKEGPSDNQTKAF